MKTHPSANCVLPINLTTPFFCPATMTLSPIYNREHNLWLWAKSQLQIFRCKMLLSSWMTKWEKRVAIKHPTQRGLTWKPSVSSVPFTRGEGAGEPDREPDLELGLELDLDDGREPDWEIWAWAIREAEVGRELGREFGKESALLILDSGAKIPDDWMHKNKYLYSVWLKVRRNLYKTEPKQRIKQTNKQTKLGIEK